MSESTLYDIVLWTWVVLGLAIFVALFFIKAPYGRYMDGGWGPRFPAKWGWLVMEAVSSIGFLAYFLLGDPSHAHTGAGIALLVLWQVHYGHRAFIYPFRRRGGHKDMPLSVVLMAIVFNLGNAYLNARWIYTLGPVPTFAPEPHAVVGLLLFADGFAINQHADAVLSGLRKPGEEGYKIPQGGFYRWISCPNYFGEMVEWIGWAVLTWSPGGAVFAFWTIANLAPRAIAHHRWYRKTFPDYPVERRALVPFIV